MRSHAPDPGGVRDGVSDALFADPAAAFDEQPRLAQAGGPVRNPLVEQLFELWVQGDVTVVAELPERHVQPVPAADLHDRIDDEIEELALPKPGPGEELDRQPGERVGVLAGGAQQLRRRGVVDEPRQRLVTAWDVTSEHQHSRRGVLAAPFAEAFQADSERAELLGQTDVRKSPAGPGASLHTARGLTIGDAIGSARRLYGHRVTTRVSRGSGSWSAAVNGGTIGGAVLPIRYPLTSIGTRNPIVTIEAGNSGC